jgi:hypothetical protein
MWQSIDSSMWTVIEYNLGIIAASMPALRRPLAAMFPILLGRRGGSSAHQIYDECDRNTRAPSTVSTASTKASHFSLGGRAHADDMSSEMKEMSIEDQKGERYRSGMRTEMFDVDSFDFDLEECERVRAEHGDLVSVRDWQNNGILKTTEVSVEPESNRSSLNQYKFPK